MIRRLARSASPGLVQCRSTVALPAVATRPDAGWGGVTSGAPEVRRVIVAAAAALPDRSWANSAYEYCVFGLSPWSVSVVLLADRSSTAVPAVLLAGAT